MFKGVRLALVLVSVTAMAGCDGEKNAGEPGSPKDRHAEAFEQGLKGCAVVADSLGNTWIGKPFTGLETWLAANSLTDVGSVRIIRPDTAVTEDYRINRLNITLDDKDVVTKLHCG
ncbi:MAG: I78 family peptidase inhibitor [Parvibaculum sp.]|nr:I78 family peptidase inhibitor [Parvibaculum sp.]